MPFLPLEQWQHHQNRNYLEYETIVAYDEQYYAHAQVSNFVTALTDLRDQLKRTLPNENYPDRPRVLSLIAKYQRMIRTQSRLAARKENTYRYWRRRLEDYGYDFEPIRLQRHRDRVVSTPKYYPPPQIYPPHPLEYDPDALQQYYYARHRKFHKNPFLRHSPN